MSEAKKVLANWDLDDSKQSDHAPNLLDKSEENDAPRPAMHNSLIEGILW